jgi:hypothetical protein
MTDKNVSNRTKEKIIYINIEKNKCHRVHKSEKKMKRALNLAQQVISRLYDSAHPSDNVLLFI